MTSSANKQTCLYCEQRTAIATLGKPVAGTAAVCLTCGDLMRFDDEMTLRKAKVEDFCDDGLEMFEFMAFYAASRLLVLKRRIAIHERN